MSTTVVSVQSESRFHLSTVEILALASAVVILIAFVLLPWMTEGENQVTG
ncbi:MAG: hypothetical protein KC547_11250 [Anaerolineae bacterium]|nr:hypothetical protein [Anaerolineae bacterium]